MNISRRDSRRSLRGSRGKLPRSRCSSPSQPDVANVSHKRTNGCRWVVNRIGFAKDLRDTPLQSARAALPES